jgi:predicted O-methyltransferase YrrM
MSDHRYNILSKLVKDNQCKKIAEIGVARGIDAQEVLKQNRNLEMFYLIEPDFDKVFEYQGVFRDFLNTSFIRLYSNKAVKCFDDGELDLVYIDACHRYTDCKEDITLWLPKVKNGGIIAGHDYIFNLNMSVSTAVDETLGKVNLEEDVDAPGVHIWWKRKE